MLIWSECPVCTSTYTVYLQDIVLQRQAIAVPQIFCMACQSFFHVSGYKEDLVQLECDASFLQDHLDPSIPDIIQYLRTVSFEGEVFEAGCGAGNLLSELSSAGFVASGIDPNPAAIRLAQSKGASVVCGYFEQLHNPVGAIICLDVLEHLEHPRTFFSDLVASVSVGGIIIVRVPEIAQHQWHWLKGADTYRDRDEADPFRDNSVHITHFSPQGLRAMGESLGAKFERELPCDLRVFRR